MNEENKGDFSGETPTERGYDVKAQPLQVEDKEVRGPKEPQKDTEASTGQ